MDRKDRKEDLPHRDQKTIERQAEKSRKQLEKIPEPGMDPLHEGP